MTLIYTVVGAVAGFWFGGFVGAILGAVLGLLIGSAQEHSTNAYWQQEQARKREQEGR